MDWCKITNRMMPLSKQTDIANEEKRSFSFATTPERAWQIFDALGPSGIRSGAVRHRPPQTMRRRATSKNQKKLPQAPQVQSQPPLSEILRGIVVLDPGSDHLNEDFIAYADDLDAAGDRYVHLTSFGNSLMSGEEYRALIGEELWRQEVQDAEEYIDKIHKSGLSTTHRLRAFASIAKKLGLKRNQRPCIVFPSEDRTSIVALLHFEKHWYNSEEARRVLFRLLPQWMCRPSVRIAARMCSNQPDSAEQIQSMLDDLAAEIDAAIAGYRRPEPPVVDSARLVVDTQAQSIHFDGNRITLNPTPARLLTTLANSPGTPIPHATLMDAASRRVDKFGGVPCQWAGNHKLAIMKVLRLVAIENGNSVEELEGLIVSRKGTLELTLSRDEILIK